MSKILPRETALSAPYWAGCRAGELRLQHCAECEQFQFYPRTLCSHCGADDLHWQAVSGAGHIASFTVVRRGIAPAYVAPYAVALIDLHEGPRMMSSIDTDDPDSLRVGAPVQVSFADWGEDCRMPVFRLV